MTLKQRKALLKWMKEEGVTHFKDGDVELFIGGVVEPHESKPKFSQIPEQNQVVNFPEIPDSYSDDPENQAQMPSDTDMLMWSTVSFDETVQGRKAGLKDD